MPIEGGRALLRGRVLGVPVHLDWSFVIVMALFGYRPGVTAVEFGLWMAITPLAVLVHELGHALVARTTGARPQIALAGFGGVTTYVPPGELTRLRSLAISLAGPGVGLAVGLVQVLIWWQVRDGLDPQSWQAIALWTGIWTCIGWSLLNLLPVLPLDGGQAMREVLPGAPPVRARRAAMVSVVVAALVIVAAFVYGQIFLGLFMLLFAVTNVAALRQPSDSEPGSPSRSGVSHSGSAEGAIVARLWAGDAAGARHLLTVVPPSTAVDLAVHGAVLALTGDPEQGQALLAQEAQRRPGDPNVAALIVLTQALQHDWDAVVATLQGPMAPTVPGAVVERAAAEARGVGREDVAGRLTVLGSD